ncbi:MAG: hypothetical protein HZA24_03820 [Nitrospirae bacterium]|nr:hypothetical protein [Nitrospirota bacterium]
MCRKLGVFLLGCLLWVPGTALADQQGGRERAGQADADAARLAAEGDVIDITGFMEWPKGDTSVPWDPPEKFERGVGLVYGLSLKDEVFQPVDRDDLTRQMEVERALGR